MSIVEKKPLDLYQQDEDDSVQGNQQAADQDYGDDA
jgi:hypothetical protein